MQRRRETAAVGRNEDTKRLNKEIKRAIRRDYKDDLKHRIAETSPQNMWRHLQTIIAPKRGAPSGPEGLTADDLNSYFTSIGEETRSRVSQRFQQSGRQPLPTRLPRVHSDALVLTPVTL